LGVSGERAGTKGTGDAVPETGGVPAADGEPDGVGGALRVPLGEAGGWLDGDGHADPPAHSVVNAHVRLSSVDGTSADTSRTVTAA
jgi:hypothetical protein